MIKGGYYLMINADEIFKKLGYKKEETYWDEDNSLHYISYSSDDTHISFYMALQALVISNILNIDEIKAVDLKLKELGWL